MIIFSNLLFERWKTNKTINQTKILKMSKFKLKSEIENEGKKIKKHSSKKHNYDREDMTDFAYMSRGAAKNELRYLRETYGI